MSAEQPDALHLLALARETLLERVVPELDGDARYQALMIANAMAIAERELGCVPELDAELAFLRGLYEHEPPPPGESDAQAHARLEARLARDLRDGVLDGGLQRSVRGMLRRRVEASLALSNPRRLRGRTPRSGSDAG